MKARSNSRSETGGERRSLPSTHTPAQDKHAATACMPDARAASMAQLQEKADASSQATQLRACADMMAGQNGAPVQRAEDEDLLQGKFPVAQREEDEELLQGKFASVQRMEDEELLQGKFDTVQRMDEEDPLQGKFEALRGHGETPSLQGPIAQAAATAAPSDMPVQAVATLNRTGLPDQLKSGIETLSGMSMDHVKVHYNSDKPSQLQAHAYAQGSEIHVAPGQEQHLPHEAWHVVQQAQGRVQPTRQMRGTVQVNDDAGLENEADVMGARAMNATVPLGSAAQAKKIESAQRDSLPVQRNVWQRVEGGWRFVFKSGLTKGKTKPNKAQDGAYFDDELGTLITRSVGNEAKRQGETQRLAINQTIAEIKMIVSAVEAANLKAFSGKIQSLNTFLSTHDDSVIDRRDIEEWQRLAKNLETDAVNAINPIFAEIKVNVDAASQIIDGMGASERETLDGHRASLNHLYDLHDDACIDARDAAPILASSEQLLQLANDWFDSGATSVGAAAATPRLAHLYFDAHILARHSRSSKAGGAGKFDSDDWTVIRGRIDSALGAGVLTGPISKNDAGDHPAGRYEIAHDVGARVGVTSSDGPATRVKVIVTRSGKSVVTAYPY